MAYASSNAYPTLTDDFPQMLQHLNSQEPLAPVYLFHGEDSYRMEQLVNALVKKRFKDAAPDPLCFEQFRCSERGCEADVRTALDAIKNISMFSGPKIVILKGTEKLKNKIDDEPLTRLTEYIANPARGTLVLVCNGVAGAKKESKAKKTTKKTENVKITWNTILDAANNAPNTLKVARCLPLGFDLKPWDPREKLIAQIQAYILDEAQNTWSLKFSPTAAKYLAEAIGPDRALLGTMIEKLKLCANDDHTITETIVREQVIDTRERSIFEISDAIMKRDIPKCLEALLAFVEQAKTPGELVLVTGTLATPVRRLLHYKLCTEPGNQMSENEICENLGVKNVWALRPIREAAALYSLNELKQLHRALYETDCGIKSSAIPNGLILSKILISILKTSSLKN